MKTATQASSKATPHFRQTLPRPRIAAPWLPPAAAPAHGARAAPRCDFLMHITVATDSVTALRRLVAASCGATLSYMRIEAVDHAARMKVWLCLPQSHVERVMDAVMGALPAAEFGRIRPLQPS